MNYLNTNERIVTLCNGTFGERQDYKLFWPFEYIPSIIESTICNVAFDVLADYSPTNTTFTNLSLYFFIICHIDIATVPGENGTRFDLIAHEITKDFAGKDFMGIGQTAIVSNHPYVTLQELRGRVLQISLFDMSQDFYNRHVLPSI